ncbi:MAG: PAS domain S-box protein [Chloroflexi bacterium]|nr:PAS domain S-box protein [Chloroflexota bacterium]
MSLLEANDAVLAKLGWDSPIAIVVSTRVDGRMLDVNDSFLRLIGYTRDEVIGRTSAELRLWADPSQRADMTAALAEGAPLRDFDASVRTKTGAERQVLASVSEADIDGTACLLTQMFDVTPYRQVETQFQALVEQLPVITYVHGLDEQRALTYISPQVETIAGYSPDEILSGQPKSLIGRVHPEDREHLLDAAEQTLRTLSPYRAEYRVQASDGRWIWLQDQASVVRDARGHPLLWQGVLIDITARKTAEEALREAEVRYRGLFEGVADAILIADADGCYLDANPAATALLGYEREELLQMRVADLVAGEPEWIATEYARYQEEGSWRGELELRRKDGSTVPVELGATVVALPTGSTYLAVLRDCTERKQAAAMLQASEKRFRALVQNSSDIIVVFDADGIRRYVSPSVEHLLGYPPADLLGQGLEELIHPDDAPRLQEAIQSCVGGANQTPLVELRIRHCDGSWRDFEAIGTNLLEEPGVAGIVFNSRDITDRKAAEVALQKSEERFRSAFDNAPTGMALLTTDGHFLQVNHSLCCVLAYSESELLGKSFAEITLAEDRNVDSDLVQHLLRGGIASYQIEKRLVRKADEVIWARLTVSLVRGSTSEPLYLVAQIQDITPFKAAGAALRESEERFRSAFSHAPIGMALVTPDDRFMQVNRALCELVGYTEEELLSKTFQAITHPDDLADEQELAARMWAGEIDTYQLEKRYIHKDGHIVWVLVTVSAIVNGSVPNYAIAQILDITGRRHVEMERAVMLASEREYSKQLRAMTEMRADLTAMIAHELRAPVSALRMMAFLWSSGELAPEDGAEMLAAAKREIDQLDRLINDIATVTDAEREDLSVQLHPVPLTMLLETAMTFSETSLREHHFSISDIPDVRVWCDPERMSQVLRNLLDNAAKHTPPGTYVEINVHRKGQRVRLEVADRGPGLSEEEVPLIFEKFGRGRQAAARQTPGAGLGLYLSRLLVEAHGSELTVETAPGSGARFAFELGIVA